MDPYYSDLFIDFLQYITSEKGLADNTLEAYKIDVQQFLLYLQIHAPLHIHLIKVEHLISYLDFLKKSEFADASVNRKLMALRGFFRFLKREKIIKDDPTKKIDSPKLWQLIPQVLSQTEIAAILKQPDISTAEGARDKAILEMLYACGLRVSELCSLEIYHVNDNFLKVKGKGNKERIIPIGKEAVKALDHYLSFDREEGKTCEKVFLSKKGKPITRQEVWAIVKKVAKAAGITKRISPHTFRHTFATHLLDNQADLRIIQDMLGHANINSTDRYTHVSAVRLKEAFYQFHPHG